MTSAIDKLIELKNIQKNSIIDPYMLGLYNGIELAISILEDRDPVYISIKDLDNMIGTSEIDPVVLPLEEAIKYENIEETKDCYCYNCNLFKLDPVSGMPYVSTRMIVCPICGNKRCPHGTDHKLECTNSNESGQPGSRYE